MNKKNRLALIFFIPELNVERLFPLRLHKLPNSELIHIIPKKFPWDLTMYSLELTTSSQSTHTNQVPAVEFYHQPCFNLPGSEVSGFSTFQLLVDSTRMRPAGVNYLEPLKKLLVVKLGTTGS